MKRRRWLWLFGIIVLLLLIAAVVGVEIVRRSDLPRQIVLEQARTQLNAQVELDEVDAGWGGHTTLRGLRLSDPLSGALIAEFPELNVDHTPLVGLAMGRPVQLDRVQAPGGRVVLRQNQTGRWNLREAIAPLLQREPTEDDQPLPAVQADGLTLRIERPGGRTLALDDVGVKLAPVEGSRRYDVAVRAGRLGTVRGAFVNGGDRPHGLWLDLATRDAAAMLWLDAPPQPLRVKGQWRGQLSDGRLTGRADLADLRAGSVQVRGRTRLALGPQGAAIEPIDLAVANVPGLDAVGEADQPVRLTAGRITAGPEQITLDQVTARLLNGSISLAGDIEPAKRRARITATWTDLAAPAQARHTGRATVQLEPAGPDRYAGSATWHVEGRAYGGELNTDGSAELTLLAPTDDRPFAITAAAGFEQLAWDGEKAAVGLAGLTADARIDADAIVVERLSLPAADGGATPALAGSGRFSFADRTWQVELRGGRLPIEAAALADLPPFDFAVDAGGTRDRIDIQTLRVENEVAVVTITGDWSADRPTPVDVTVDATYTGELAFEGAGLTFRTDELGLNAAVTGTLFPMALHVDGPLVARRLHLGQMPREQLRIAIDATVRDDAVTLEGEPFQLLGGTWTAQARWDRATNDASAGLTMQSVDLARLDELTGTALELRGMLGGALEITLPQLDRDKLELAGRWEVHGPAWRGMTVDQASGKLRMLEKDLRLDAVEFKRGQGLAACAIRINLPADRIQLRFEVDDWPVEYPSADLAGRISGEGILDVNPAENRFVGPVDLQTTWRRGEVDVATLKLDGRLLGRRAELKTVTGHLLGGRISGSGTADFDRPATSELHIAARGVSLARVAEIWPNLSETSGLLEVTFDLAEADDPRAPGPMKGVLTVNSAPDAPVKYRGMQFEQGSASMYLVPASAQASEAGRWVDRLLLQRSTWELAQGSLGFWGRVTWRPQGWFYYANVELDKLDMAAVIAAAAPERQNPPRGKLSGTVMLTGPVGRIERRYGKADLRITEADLANEGVIAGIYGLLNFDLDDDPTGTGKATLRLEGDRATISNAVYQNRGVTFRLGGQLGNISAGRATPVAGYAMVISNVMPDVPLLEQVGEAVGAVQSFTNAVRFTGTWAEPNVKWVPLEQAASTVEGVVPGGR